MSEAAYFCDEVSGPFSCCDSCHEDYEWDMVSMVEREHEGGGWWIVCCAASRQLDHHPTPVSSSPEPTPRDHAGKVSGGE